MVITKLPLVAELVGSGVSGSTQKLDDVVNTGAAGVGTVVDPIAVGYTAEDTVFVKRLVLSHHKSAGTFTMNDFGGVSLAEGFEVVKIAANGSEKLLSGETGLKKYTDFIEKGFIILRDLEDADWYQLVLDFQESCGTYIRLRKDERIEVRAKDDISGISHVAWSITGFKG